MNRYQVMVENFHQATGSTVGQTPELRDAALRARLIMEEAVETVAALGFDAEASITGDTPDDVTSFFKEAALGGDFPEVIDGLCDLLYVTFGTAVAAGIDLDPFFVEVHRSNMEKLAGPKRADGKQLKPIGWKPPRIAQILGGLMKGSHV